MKNRLNRARGKADVKATGTVQGTWDGGLDYWGSTGDREVQREGLWVSLGHSLMNWTWNVGERKRQGCPQV